MLLKDPDEYSPKPWTEPNQKISDYFNYSMLSKKFFVFKFFE